MKKLFCLVLCIIFVLSLSACGNSNSATVKHSVDIEYFVKLGQIDNFKYKLGDNVDDTKTQLSETVDEESGESIYFDFPSGDYTIMTDGAAYCCYKTDDKAAGITHIVKCDGAFGFEIGAVSTEVRTAMSSLGLNADEREAKRGEIFFLPAGADMTVLEYKIKENTVLFVFQDHYLAATVVTK